MQLEFLGGAGEVGRSGILVRGDSTFLLDYGVKLDDVIKYPIMPDAVDCCVLSHAHLDHSGFVPALFVNFSPRVIATEPTIRLAELLIEDSIKIAKRNGERPVFYRSHLKKMLGSLTKCRYGGTVDIGKYEVTLHDAGHICGSAITVLEKNSRRLVYTGDFKLGEQMLHKGAEVVKSDILVIESTYALREHPDREEMTKQFIDDVAEVIGQGGVALLPVFAVGRAQEMLALLKKNGLIDITYLDGMAKDASDIVMRNADFIRNSRLLSEAMNSSLWIEQKYQRGKALQGGNIILTTSGMITGGPVLDYITRLNSKSKIFLTGYQVEGTNGRKLLDGKRLNIDKRMVSIKTPVAFYDFSAHAGKSDLHEYVRRSEPESVVCVHGSAEATMGLAESLREEGYDSYAPKVGERITLEF